MWRKKYTSYSSHFSHTKTLHTIVNIGREIYIWGIDYNERRALVSWVGGTGADYVAWLLHRMCCWYGNWKIGLTKTARWRFRHVGGFWKIGYPKKAIN